MVEMEWPNHTMQMLEASRLRHEDCLIFPTNVSLKLQKYFCYQAVLQLIKKTNSNNGLLTRISWKDEEELKSIVLTSHQLYKSTFFEIAPKRDIVRMMAVYPTVLKTFNTREDESSDSSQQWESCDETDDSQKDSTHEEEVESGFQLNVPECCIPGMINLGENVEYDPVYPEDGHGGQTHDFKFKLANSKKSFSVLNVRGRVDETLLADCYYAIIYNYPEGVLKILFKASEGSQNFAGIIGKTVNLDVRIVIDSQSRIISLIDSVNGIKTDDCAGNTRSLDSLRERNVLKLSSEKKAREMVKMTLQSGKVTNKADKKSVKDAAKMKTENDSAQEKDDDKKTTKADNKSGKERNADKVTARTDDKYAEAKVVDDERSSITSSKTSLSSKKQGHVEDKKLKQSDHGNKLPSFEWKTCSGNQIKQLETKLETVDWKEIGRKDIKNEDNNDVELVEDEIEVMLRGKLKLRKGGQLLALNHMAVNLLALSSASDTQ